MVFSCWNEKGEHRHRGSIPLWDGWAAVLRKRCAGGHGIYVVKR
ncbi:hypothetical protein HMPREF9080_02914 [Cardiobacterium valvarum F0432]|uniref:Uncharacterized protein n=1 Tax=Cardiobacterium valvarum F0432 TaxID=797473 RepID=G9ZJE4_9GAMM|nr:hypothetical protein HMPREF9080_02914 [Cardiobacterium valvarum F0432]